MSKNPNISQFINENYSNHCISGLDKNLHHVPFKLVKSFYCENKPKYFFSVEYLECSENLNVDSTYRQEWTDFKTYCSFFPNLKIIFHDHLFQIQKLSDLSHDPNQNIWKQRISYLQF